jgi:hypothetical protein
MHQLQVPRTLCLSILSVPCVTEIINQLTSVAGHGYAEATVVYVKCVSMFKSRLHMKMLEKWIVAVNIYKSG